LLEQLIHFFHDMPNVINAWSVSLGPVVYLLLFLIIFSETGLVILPFLPGDSLLFALGALAATANSNLKLPYLMALLPLAALSGDLLNYHIGKFLGKKFLNSDSGWINKKHLHKTQAFYDRHGGKTICFARFVPIVRTYAPFVAGVGQMKISKFLSYSVFGAYVWIFSFLSMGYYFGNIPSIKTNFHFVILAIIIISVLPGIFEIVRSNREQRTATGNIRK